MKRFEIKHGESSVHLLVDGEVVGSFKTQLEAGFFRECLYELDVMSRNYKKEPFPFKMLM